MHFHQLKVVMLNNLYLLLLKIFRHINLQFYVFFSPGNRATKTREQWKSKGDETDCSLGSKLKFTAKRIIWTIQQPIELDYAQSSHRCSARLWLGAEVVTVWRKFKVCRVKLSEMKPYSLCKCWHPLGNICIIHANNINCYYKSQRKFQKYK